MASNLQKQYGMDNIKEAENHFFGRRMVDAGLNFFAFDGPGQGEMWSSMKFALFFMGEYANIVIGACLTVILFLGGWACPFGDLGFFPFTHHVGWFLLKIYLIIFVFIWIRWTFPRTTIYGLLNLSWKYLIPISLFNLLLTAGLLKVF